MVNNVIRLPTFHTSLRASDGEEVQLELFPALGGSSKVFLIQSVDENSEATLKDCIARRAPSVIVDMRWTQLFDERRYNHKSMSDYIHSRNIRYVNMINLVRDHAQSDPWKMARIENDIARILNGFVENGVRLVLIDQSPNRTLFRPLISGIIRVTGGCVIETL
jgi:hypothetical protein